MSKKRRNLSSKFKSKVALEALKERATLSELAQKHQIHANQISTWKKELLANSHELFEKKRGPEPSFDKSKEALLYQQIGQLQYELNWAAPRWLKKKTEQLF